MEDGRKMCERKWVHSKSSSEERVDDISVMTYNILTDSHCTVGEFSCCPDDIRYENSRGPHVIAEIQHFSPDVVCLQELQVCHYKSVILPGLERLGYTGVHMTYTHRGSGNGLGMFHRQNTVSLEESSQFQYWSLINEYLQEGDLSDEDKDDLRNVAKKGSGLLAFRFKQISSGKTVTIGTTHVTWSQYQLPLLQTLEIALLHRRLKRVAGLGCFIFCGDFNCTQTFEPYQLLSKGAIHTGRDRTWNPSKDVRLFKLKKKDDSSDGYAFDEEAVEVSPDDILEGWPRDRSDIAFDVLAPLLSAVSKEIPLKSAYHGVMGREPEVTHCDADSWRGYVSEMCLDYLWYTAGLQVTRVLEPPARESIRRKGALPNYLHPSDHIPLVAGFKLL